MILTGGGAGSSVCSGSVGFFCFPRVLGAGGSVVLDVGFFAMLGTVAAVRVVRVRVVGSEGAFSAASVSAVFLVRVVVLRLGFSASVAGSSITGASNGVTLIRRLGAAASGATGFVVVLVVFLGGSATMSSSSDSSTGCALRVVDFVGFVAALGAAVFVTLVVPSFFGAGSSLVVFAAARARVTRLMGLVGAIFDMLYGLGGMWCRVKTLERAGLESTNVIVGRA